MAIQDPSHCPNCNTEYAPEDKACELCGRVRGQVAQPAPRNTPQHQPVVQKPFSIWFWLAAVFCFWPLLLIPLWKSNAHKYLKIGITSIFGLFIVSQMIYMQSPQYKKEESKRQYEQKIKDKESEKQRLLTEKKEKAAEEKAAKKEQAEKDALLLARMVQYAELNKFVKKYNLSLRPFDKEAPTIITVVSPGPIDNYSISKMIQEERMHMPLSMVFTMTDFHID
jgi:hypothetical protein